MAIELWLLSLELWIVELFDWTDFCACCTLRRFGWNIRGVRFSSYLLCLVGCLLVTMLLVLTLCLYIWLGSEPDSVWSSSFSYSVRLVKELLRVVVFHPNMLSFSLWYYLFYLRNKEIDTIYLYHFYIFVFCTRDN